ncbi:hypothetical protein Zmor_016326 [Zophobas morio]|jgi:hypothetical protein|uniref:Uncharacterized protein n=1 Tax=Zophobas morio TaxID=2755281 RepID=A0AA38HG67_9CUCU|nr:hypothetical protein Zmor_016326 [Zophobas morio]
MGFQCAEEKLAGKFLVHYNTGKAACQPSDDQFNSKREQYAGASAPWRNCFRKPHERCKNFIDSLAICVEPAALSFANNLLLLLVCFFKVVENYHKRIAGAYQSTIEAKDAPSRLHQINLKKLSFLAMEDRNATKEEPTANFFFD